MRGKGTKLGEAEREIPKILKNSGLLRQSQFGKITFGIVSFGKSLWRPNYNKNLYLKEQQWIFELHRGKNNEQSITDTFFKVMVPS